MLSDRISTLKSYILSCSPEIFPDRARIVTASYLESHGQPFIIRRAKAFKDILGNLDIHIRPGELIVGCSTATPRGCQVFPEYDMGYVVDELDFFENRTADRFIVSEVTKEHLRAIYAQWENNSLADVAWELFDEEQKSCSNDLIYILTAMRSGIGHMVVNYRMVLDVGLVGIIHTLSTHRDALDKHDPDYSAQLLFYNAVETTCNALISFAHRYSSLAAELATRESDEYRRNELLMIARNCHRVPKYPSQNFWEALQSFWFIHLALHLETNGHSISPGRFDQYMYPFFQRDINLEIPEEVLVEQLHSLWLKLFELNKVRDKISSVAFGGYPMFQNLILGGQDAHGHSAVNRLSHICLEATALLKLPQPSLSIRWFFGCEENFLEHVFRVISLGLGMPALFNDEVLIPNMLQMGYSITESRDYAIVGCTETTGQGNVEPWLTGGFLNALKILELTIFNGTDPVTGTVHLLHTGDVSGIKSFEEFLTAYHTQLAYYLGVLVSCDNTLDTIHASICPTPFQSALIHDCLESGKTSLGGGAKYNSTTLEVVGLPNVVDSLVAIKTLVYDEKRIDWERLKHALSADFAHEEPLKQFLKNRIAKYGNDNESVDLIGSNLVDFLFEEIKCYRSPRGGVYRLALYSIASHILFARKTGATPDGRGCGDFLADGGVSCSQGMDKEGLTALLNSVVKLDPMKALGSCLLNVRLSPSLFNGINLRKTLDTIKTFFLNKGQHIQFNVFDTAMLRDAQEHPDRYPTLMVRVAGFSVLFTSIEKQLQDDIIARTEQSDVRFP